MHELPDQYLTDVLPIAKKIAIAQGVPNYNILQNNGKIAHQVCRTFQLQIHLRRCVRQLMLKRRLTFSTWQEVPHVHFHVIPKPSESQEEGLVVGWPAKPMDKEELAKVFEDLKAKLQNPPAADSAL